MQSSRKIRLDHIHFTIREKTEELDIFQMRNKYFSDEYKPTRIVVPSSPLHYGCSLKIKHQQMLSILTIDLRHSCWLKQFSIIKHNLRL